MFEVGDRVSVLHYDDKTSTSGVVVDLDITTKFGLRYVVQFDADGLTEAYKRTRLTKEGK